MARKGMDTMTVIKSICSGVGALSAVLICASVLYSEQGKLEENKLDKEVFVEYRVEERRDKAQYRSEQKEEHFRISEAVSEMQTDVGIIKTILEERNKE